jgi:hypothetical protein
MSKRKGLSLEEKRDKVLEVFTESADVFVLKVSQSHARLVHHDYVVNYLADYALQLLEALKPTHSWWLMGGDRLTALHSQLLLLLLLLLGRM